VAVTHGCLKLLSRDELQGVIGHEFSHILNGDMKLNVRLIGILFGIFCIATIGRIMISMRSNNSRDRNPLPLVGVVLLVVGSLGLFFGRLIQAAVSRQREFLADASSVQFTRNPRGLSGALQKIGGYGFGSWLISDHAPDAGHLFFGNGIPRPMFGMMATHRAWIARRSRKKSTTWRVNRAPSLWMDKCSLWAVPWRTRQLNHRRSGRTWFYRPSADPRRSIWSMPSKCVMLSRTA
jgi:hypothetical protein